MQLAYACYLIFNSFASRFFKFGPLESWALPAWQLSLTRIRNFSFIINKSYSNSSPQRIIRHLTSQNTYRQSCIHCTRYRTRVAPDSCRIAASYEAFHCRYTFVNLARGLLITPSTIELCSVLMFILFCFKTISACCKIFCCIWKCGKSLLAIRYGEFDNFYFTNCLLLLLSRHLPIKILDWNILLCFFWTV